MDKGCAIHKFTNSHIGIYTQGKLTRMNSHEIRVNIMEISTHEKETKNKHTNIARRKHTIFMRILHDFMRFLYDLHVKLISHDFLA